MALSAINFINKGPVLHNDLLQFYSLFTGAMTDQPVTFKNTVSIGGSQGLTTVPLKLYGAAGQTSHLIDLYADAGQAQPGFGFSAIGSFAWGPGGAAPQDTFLSRVATQNGHATDTAGLLLVPYLEVAGAIQGTSYHWPNGTTLTSSSPFSVTLNQDLTVQRFLVVSARAGIGMTPGTNLVLGVAGSATATGTVAYGLLETANLIAAANADQLHGADISPTFDGGGHSNISAYGLVVTAPAVSNTPGTSVGTGIWVNSPVGNSGGTNRGVYISAPSGGANNYGLEIGGGTIGLVVDAGGASVTGSSSVYGTAGVATAFDVAGIATTYGFLLNPSMTAANVVGAYLVPTINSTVTGNADVINVSMNTQAAAFTLASANMVHIVSPAKGAGSGITGVNGLYIDAITAGSGANRGIYVGPPSGGATTNVGVQIGGGGPALQIDGGGATVTGGVTMNGDGNFGWAGGGGLAPGNTIARSRDTVYLFNHAYVFFDIGLGHDVHGDNGQMYAHAFNVVSDPRLKGTLTPLTPQYCLGEVLDTRMQPYTYANLPQPTPPPGYTATTSPADPNAYGFSAVEVALVCPQVVTLDASHQPSMVALGNLVPILWGAVRQLDARLKAIGA